MTKNVQGTLVTRGNNTLETARKYLADRSMRLDNGCIVWTKSTQGSRYAVGLGYGQAWYQGKAIAAHVLAYLVEKGPIGPDQHVRHSCDNPPCINGDHLLLGSRVNNMQDMISRGRHFNQRKTHCKNGHEFTPENTYERRPGWRACRQCGREANARYIAGKSAS